MKGNDRTKNSYLIRRVALVAMVGLMFAVPGQAGEKRFLVRYDHGTAQLSPYAGLKLCVSPERIRVYAGDTLVHDITPTDVNSFTHELRSPFDPAKVAERTMNDTVGSCSNLIDCPVLGAAGVAAVTGVGVATLFTPKQQVITLNWNENGQNKELAVQIAWYQRNFILGALEKATGKKAAERKSGPQPSVAGPPVAPGSTITTVRATAFAVQPGWEPRLIRRFELILDREARLGETQLAAGFYMVLLQERAGGRAAVVFLDDSVRNPEVSRVVARTEAECTPGAEEDEILPLLRESPDGLVLTGVRLPGRTLRFSL